MDFFENQRRIASQISASYNTIQKSETSDIEKAEGSRGGKVIGHTKSGKAIYGVGSHLTASHEDYKKYTKQDHLDAAEFHHDKYRDYQNEASRSPSTNSSIRRDKHQSMMGEHYDKAHGVSTKIGEKIVIGGSSYKKYDEGKYRKERVKNQK